MISMHMNQRDLHKGQKSLMGHKSAIPNTMRSYLGLIETICSSWTYNQGSLHSDFDAHESKGST